MYFKNRLIPFHKFGRNSCAVKCVKAGLFDENSGDHRLKIASKYVNKSLVIELDDYVLTLSDTRIQFKNKWIICNYSANLLLQRYFKRLHTSARALQLNIKVNCGAISSMVPCSTHH